MLNTGTKIVDSKVVNRVLEKMPKESERYILRVIQKIFIKHLLTIATEM